MKNLLLSLSNLLAFFFLLAINKPHSVHAQNNPAEFIGTNIGRGTDLLILRTAISVAGEYTQAAAGNNDEEKVQSVLKEMRAWIEEINATYGREFCMRFELISEDLLRKIIFTDPETDPWPYMEGSGCDNSERILDIQEKEIDAIIGAGNYDFGHVILYTIGGGCAQLGGPKGGYSGTFDIPVTRHEMGHQLAQDHTINNDGSNNYEPENAGRSMHGGNSEPYAHSSTYHATAKFLQEKDQNFGKKISTGNHIPTVNAGPDKCIPVGTPFMLKAISSDPDAGDQLTYAWDQLDRGPMQSLPNVDQSQGALFSRLVPTKNPYRIFPMPESLVKNEFKTDLEVLPQQARELNFRLTVNDNHQYKLNGKWVNASGTLSDDVKITVVNNGGPFYVSSHSSTMSLKGSSKQTIKWSLGGSNQAPINCKNVKISLSTDGGFSFPIVLVESTANSGSAEITLPNISTSKARIKVEAIDNYFFSINKANFSISQDPNMPGILVQETGNGSIVNENGQTDEYQLSLLSQPSGNVNIRIEANNQIELSADGKTYSKQLVLSFNSMSPQLVQIRAIKDNAIEGSDGFVLQHIVSESGDPNNYPVGSQGQVVQVRISDAQMPPVIGVDFDSEESNSSPSAWKKVSDLRNLHLKQLSFDDGTESNISLKTSASECGIGGCGFDSGVRINSKHCQSLEGLSGVAYTQGEVSFTWSGLEPKRKYKVYVFGLGEFGPMDQQVSIQGLGNPVQFRQAADTSVPMVNQWKNPSNMLVEQGVEVMADQNGEIRIQVRPSEGVSEMSFAGIALSR